MATIHRAVINIKEKDDAKGKKGDKELLVEGYGLQKCMITEGILGSDLGRICLDVFCKA